MIIQMSETPPKRVIVIQGHPDPQGGHFCHALAEAYERAARAAGHEVRNIVVAQLDFPLLRRKQDWDDDPASSVVRQAQQDILWAEHAVIIYPLWLGGMPALLKAFF